MKHFIYHFTIIMMPILHCLSSPGDHVWQVKSIQYQLSCWQWNRKLNSSNKNTWKFPFLCQLYRIFMLIKGQFWGNQTSSISMSWERQEDPPYFFPDAWMSTFSLASHMNQHFIILWFVNRFLTSMEIWFLILHDR